jgi:hypothetical protein
MSDRSALEGQGETLLWAAVTLAITISVDTPLQFRGTSFVLLRIQKRPLKNMKTQLLGYLCVLTMAAPAAAVDIAWIGMHATDAPHQDAANHGYTTATDIGYVDLLRNDGHSVTRLLTQTPANATTGQAFIDNLNTFDLVIVSRQVGSGDYGEGTGAGADAVTERTRWHSGVTKPMMLMSGYVLRNNRLQFMTGDTIPDAPTTNPATGAVVLTAAVPNHSIFEGITLDGSNNMNFAMYPISAPDGSAMQGISVVTDPIAGGGTVLARVSSSAASGANGMLIGHWPAGAVLGGNTLAAPRMAFMSGTREPIAPNNQIPIAGVKDLTAAGDQLFLNSVCFMIGGCGPPLVPGDTDGDQVVEFADFEPIRANFRKAVGERTMGDLVDDNIIDFEDFHQWKAAFVGGGGSLAGLDLSFGTNVPEPGTAALLLLTAIATAVFARSNRY